MILKELTIESTHEASELVADLLWDISEQGVNIYDKQDLMDLIQTQGFWDYVDSEAFNLDDKVYIKAYFKADEIDEKVEEVKARLAELKLRSLYPLGTLEMTINDVDDKAWFENWKKTYKPIECKKIMIVPKWINEEFKDKIVIKMDPGMAFGSGEHESTKMCLEFLQEIKVEGKSVVDVGCGSGILALSAKALGAKDIEAYDIDDIAVSAAKINAKENGFEDIKIENSNLLEKSNKTFDVVLANITSEVLKMLAKSLRKYVNKDGIVIISGILESLEHEVLKAFTDLDFEVMDRKHKGEWVAFKLKVKDGN